MKIKGRNRQANRNYEIHKPIIQAGLSLYGWEIKSIRKGDISMDNSFIDFKSKTNNVLLLKQVYIKPQENVKELSMRSRQLLLNKNEINKLRKSKDKGFTIVALCIGISSKGYAKVDIALAKGLKKYDKRNKEREKEVKRNIKIL